MCRDDPRFRDEHHHDHHHRGHRWGPDGFGPPDEVYHHHGPPVHGPGHGPREPFGPPPPPPPGYEDARDAGPFGFRRHFISDAEVIEMLEEYLDELEKEAQGVREAIAELKAELEAEREPGDGGD